MSSVIRHAARLLHQADALVITAGAGIGVDSGLPDFRGNEGFWKAYPPLKGISFSSMANPQWFESQPRRAWGFYGHRLNLYRNTTPHRGFEILLDLGRSKPLGVFVFTSNVDGQFQRAGFRDDEVCECHGSIHYLQPVHTGWSDAGAIVSADGVEIEVDEETLTVPEGLPLPTMPGGEPARPNILMFGDGQWLSARTGEQEENMNAFLKRVEKEGGRLAVVDTGAGTAVPTARNTAEWLAVQFNAKRSGRGSLVRINPREAHIDSRRLPEDCKASIEEGCLAGLEQLELEIKSLV